VAGARIDLKLEGGDELIKEMRALGVNVKKSLRGAVRAGAKVIQDAAEENARGVSGQSGKHTRLITSARQPTSVEFSIAPSKKKFFMRFFETGATAHEISGNPIAFEGDRGLVVIGGVHHPGMPAQPWLRPAFDAKGKAAVAALDESLRATIEEAKIEAEGRDDEE